jgi:hypothetical protein
MAEAANEITNLGEQLAEAERGWALAAMRVRAIAYEARRLGAEEALARIDPDELAERIAARLAKRHAVISDDVVRVAAVVRAYLDELRAAMEDRR